MYASLSERLKQDLKWTVHTPELVSRDFNYEALRQQKTTGWQSRPITGENISSFTAPGIVEAWTIDRMSADERAELAKHLGVDAIVVAQLRVELKKGGGLKQLVGAGDYFPQATLTFKVYEPKGDDTFWQDTWARGEPVAVGTGHFAGLTNAAALNRQVVVAAESAYRALITRYQAKAAEKL